MRLLKSRYFYGHRNKNKEKIERVESNVSIRWYMWIKFRLKILMGVLFNILELDSEKIELAHIAP